MTERWRKKLGDLDKQGPTDDVFERAKDGPTHLDQPLPGMKTSTRIATAVAAFAVFALAISVFAIPALRMQGTAAGGATGGMFPLWPSQTSDQLKQLQAEADGGNADWALAPKAVAERFAQDVMGWPDAAVAQAYSSSCIVAWGGYYPGDASSAGNVPGTIDGPTSGPIPCPSTSPSGYAPPWLEGASGVPSTGFDGGEGGFVTFNAFPCPGSLTQCIEFGAERITVYQPLERGTGQIWAVMEAHSDSITLSTASTQNVRSGASIGATSQYQRGVTTLGYASCGSSGGSSDGRSVTVGFSIIVDTSLPASANCSGAQPGYAWAAQATTSLADGQGGVAIDPLQTTPGSTLLGLTAVPVTMTFPDVPAQMAPPSGGSDGEPTATPSPNGSTSDRIRYTDPAGWSIEVPAAWESRSIANTSVTGIGGSGEEFVGGGLTVDVFQGEAVVLPADDSSYPLAYDSLLTPQSSGVLTGGFRGDGEAFSIRVTPNGAQLTSAQEAILRTMVESIGFEHWSAGDTRTGWSSAGPIDAEADGQWVSFGNSHVFARFKDGQRSVLGPFPPCSTGEGTFGTDVVVAGRTVISIHCPDGDVGQWDFAGDPLPGNPSYFDASIVATDAVLSWDGQLLLQREVPGSTPTP